ncbi:uncharacterized protein LOC117649482 isoform X2 [Thrips palmi]|uniref:Uncharacterized protein LOC117649482 isoform X2 n=1 Tax=Thrips palmi TaxID=161013 RepID=A0A6P8ZSK5_THRPL|nr:uncharacterized protein LOC117649482 isoform X2 [Thrips palmi]
MIASPTSAAAVDNATRTWSHGSAAVPDDALPAGLDAELFLSDAWSRRHYWQALLLLSVGLSVLLGAFVFLLAALSARHGRHGCTAGTAGAAAATLSSLVLVVLLICTRTVAVDAPKYA